MKVRVWDIPLAGFPQLLQCQGQMFFISLGSAVS